MPAHRRTKKRKSKKKSQKSKSPADDGVESFNVEVILAVRAKKGSCSPTLTHWITEFEYLAEWFGYEGPDKQTWEPESSFVPGSERLLDSFKEEMNIVSGVEGTYSYKAEPGKTWIQEQRRIFKEQYEH